MLHLHCTHLDQTFCPQTEPQSSNSANSPNPRRIFARANQGSVTKTKDRFEQRTAESRIPVTLTGPRPRCTTPFSKTRSPSPSPDLRDKKRAITKHKMCFNCLGAGHVSSECKSVLLCKSCRGKHHSLLCHASNTPPGFKSADKDKKQKEWISLLVA